MATAAPPLKKLKILMLHGYTQSGPLFHAKTRALEKHFWKAFPKAPSPGHLPGYPGGVELHYPTAPIQLQAADVPGDNAYDNADNDGKQEQPDAWAWWRRKGEDTFVYEGLELGFARIGEVLRDEGPFDGVIGFSQGGACAGMLASLLEPGRKDAFSEAMEQGGIRYPEEFAKLTEGHPPLKFASFYKPKIKTPMLHFLGSLDTVVEESRSLRLVEACEASEGRVVYHPGGHFLPSSQKQYVAPLIGFIREIITTSDQPKAEEGVEDMDMPF